MRASRLWLLPLILCTWIFCLAMDGGGGCDGPTTPAPAPVGLAGTFHISPGTPVPGEQITIRATVEATGPTVSIGGTLRVYRVSQPDSIHLSHSDLVGTQYFAGHANYPSPMQLSLPAGRYRVQLAAEAQVLGESRIQSSYVLRNLYVGDCGPAPSVNGHPIEDIYAGTGALVAGDVMLDLGIVPAGLVSEFPLELIGGPPPLVWGGAHTVAPSIGWYAITPDRLTLRPPAGTVGRFDVVQILRDGCSPQREHTVHFRFGVAADACGTPAPQFDQTASNVPGSVGVPFNFRLAAIGQAPFTYAVEAGSTLPSGLSLSGDRVVGTPLVAGFTSVRFVATDACATPRHVAAAYSFQIFESGTCPFIAEGGWDGGTANIGVPYSHEVNFSGGVAPFTLSVTDPATMPPGLALVGSRIEGTPTAGGTYAVGITVRDSCPSSAPRELTYPIEVNCPALAFTTTSLPAAVIGQPYQQDIDVAGGLGEVSLTLVSGTLPAGLSFFGDTISGTSTAAESRTFTIRATDTCSPPQTVDQVFTIASASSCLTLAWPIDVLLDGEIGVAYSDTIHATGGAGSITYVLASESVLPPGLTLSTGGAISGTPSATGVFAFAVRATDQCTPPQIVERTFSLTVAGCLSLGFSTAPVLPGATVGVPYSTTLVASGGTAPYTFVVEDIGGLPEGLTLSTGGVISGTPTQVVAADFVAIRVTDSCQPPQTALETFTFSVSSGCPAVSIRTRGLAGAVVGVPYSDVVEAFAGTPPYSFVKVATAGPLPPGLTLNSDGTINGTPTSAFTSTFRVQVTDACEATAQSELTLEAVAEGTCPSMQISTETLPRGQANSSYQGEVPILGGTLPYFLSIESGRLPLGMSIQADGRLSGVPLEDGTFIFELRVQDSCTTPQVDQETVTLVIDPEPCPPLSFDPATLPDAIVDEAYNFIVRALGGRFDVTFELIAGSLPPGMVLGSLGQLVGTATSPGTFDFTIRITDLCEPAQVVTRPFTLLVRPCREIVVIGASPPDAIVNEAYSYNFYAVQGAGTITYRVGSEGGPLPPGLTLSETGLLSGTPITQGEYDFDVIFSDECSPLQEVTREVSLGVE